MRDAVIVDETSLSAVVLCAQGVYGQQACSNGEGPQPGGLGAFGPGAPILG